MAIPEPTPGLVIRFSYLWASEHASGREEGSKDRPAAIVAALAIDASGDKRVLVLPITHSPPTDPATAIEIPHAVKTRLGLDWERSWILLTEANEFLWPGPDLRRVPGQPEGSFAYGYLPPGLFEQVRTAFVAAVRTRRMTRVPRTD